MSQEQLPIPETDADKLLKVAEYFNAINGGEVREIEQDLRRIAERLRAIDQSRQSAN